MKPVSFSSILITPSFSHFKIIAPKISVLFLFYLMCSNRSDMPSDIINTTSAKANNNHTGFNSESQYLRS
jgi:hypothetical protein